MYFRRPGMGRAAWKIVVERVSGYRQASIADEKDERTQKWGRGTRGGVSACHGLTFGNILRHSPTFGNASRPSRPAFTKSRPSHGMRVFLVPRRPFGDILCHSPTFGNAGEKSWREGPAAEGGAAGLAPDGPWGSVCRSGVAPVRVAYFSAGVTPYQAIPSATQPSDSSVSFSFSSGV